MENNWKSYAEVLHSRGFRMTPQRQLILDAIHQGSGHSTPNEIYDRVNGKLPAVNRATVYRTLEFLLELGLVTTAHGKGNQLLYELASPTPHHHLVCRCCDRVVQVDHAQVAACFAKLEQAYHFSIQTDHLVLFGVCESCSRRVPQPPLLQSGAP